MISGNELVKQSEIVKVVFGDAYTDIDIPTLLRPENPDDIDYAVIRISVPGVVYHDASADRIKWAAGLIRLRCSVDAAIAEIRLSVRAEATSFSWTGQDYTPPTPATPGEGGDLVDGAVYDVHVNAAAAIAWSKISKTGSSLSDLSSRSVANLSDGADLARRNAANTFSAAQTIGAYNFTVDSGTFFVDATNNRVGIKQGTPLYALDLLEGNGELGKAFRVQYAATSLPLLVGVTRSSEDAYLAFNATQDSSGDGQTRQIAAGAGRVRLESNALTLRAAASSTAGSVITWGEGVGLTPGNVTPTANYAVALGSLTNKYLTLHAAELWVETLVAQETMATIGGRVLVGPTSELTRDCGISDTDIYVKHTGMLAGDVLHLETSGKVEFIRVEDNPVFQTEGDYLVEVTRNLDGSGANSWPAGSAVFNTGAIGDGFIDLYSINGVRSASELGPTIVGNVRTATGLADGTNFNAWAPRWAIGNLDGLYGYSGTTYGAAFGIPAGAWIKIDPTYGIRIGHNATTKIQLDADGNATFTGNVTLTTGSSGYTTLTDKPTLGSLADHNTVDLSTEVTNKSLANLDSTANSKLSGIAAGATVGATWGTDLANVPAQLGTPTGSGLFLSSTYLGFFDSPTWKTYMDSSGNFVLGDPTGTAGLVWNQAAGTLSIKGAVAITSGSGFATVASVQSAQSTADTAVSNAATADGKAGTATNTANSATSTANSAVSTANSASSTASGALATANNAQADADQAISDAAAAAALANTKAKVDLSNVTAKWALAASSGGLASGVFGSTTIGATPGTGAGLYLGGDYLGYFNGSAWKTYMSSTGNFYLGGTGGKLTWDGTTLAISGQIIIESGSSGYAGLTDKPTLGTLAAKDSVDLTSGEVTNKSLYAVDQTASNKLAGIASGATVGAVWGSNLSDIPAHFGSPSGTGLFVGSTALGYYTGGAWKTYLDNSGNFILGDFSGGNPGLAWNQAAGTLNIRGAINITSLVDFNYAASDSPAGAATSLAGQGSLATKSSVDLATEVTNKSLSVLDSTADTKLTGISAGATVGADWATNLSNIPVRLGSPSGSGLFLSASAMGFYTSSAWKTYIDNSGNMVLGDFAGGSAGLAWNQSAGTLNIRGAINITSVSGLNYAAASTPGGAATSLAGQGALATLNAADWATNVTGTGKPADGATKNIISYAASSSPPVGPGTGDLWYQTDTYLLKKYNGASWDTVSTAYSNTNQLTDGAGLGTTALWTGVSGTGRPADNATVGADWTGNLSNRPTELTDGRVSAGLSTQGWLVSKVVPALVAAPNGSGLFLGSDYLGYYNGSAWKTYMDNSGNFYLGGTSGKLTWNGTTLAIEGTVTSTDGTIGGFSLGETDLYAGSGATRVQLSVAGQDSYRAQVLVDAPNAFWTFGEAAGPNTYDQTTSANTLIGTGGTFAQSATALSNGSTSVLLNGTSQYFLGAADAAFEVGDTFTFEAWVKRSRNDQYEFILDKGTGSWRFLFYNYGYVQLRKEGVGLVVSSTTAITDTNWHYLVVTKSGSTAADLKIYIDGTDSTDTGTRANATFTDSGSALYVGTESTITAYTGAYLQNIAIYPTCLSSTRVTAHYAARLSTAAADQAIWAGATAFTAAPFSVSSAGKLKATYGTIGGLILTDSSIRNADNTFHIDADGETVIGKVNFSIGAALNIDCDGGLAMLTGLGGTQTITHNWDPDTSVGSILLSGNYTTGGTFTIGGGGLGLIQLGIYDSSNTPNLFYIGDGIVTGTSVSSGDYKGNGTINALGGLYVNGTAVLTSPGNGAGNQNFDYELGGVTHTAHFTDGLFTGID